MLSEQDLINQQQQNIYKSKLLNNQYNLQEDKKVNFPTLSDTESLNLQFGTIGIGNTNQNYQQNLLQQNLVQEEEDEDEDEEDEEDDEEEYETDDEEDEEDEEEIQGQDNQQQMSNEQIVRF